MNITLQVEDIFIEVSDGTHDECLSLVKELARLLGLEPTPLERAVRDAENQPFQTPV